MKTPTSSPAALEDTDLGGSDATAPAGWLYRLTFVVGVLALVALLGAGLYQSFRLDSSLPYGALAYGRTASRALAAGDLERARLEFSGIFRVNPDDSNSGLRWADLLLQAGDEEQAEVVLQSVADRAGDIRASLRLALRAAERGEVATAEQLLEGLVEQYPRQVDTRIRLGDLLAGQGDHAAALVHYEAALAVEPSLPGLTERIRVARRLAGDTP